MERPKISGPALVLAIMKKDLLQYSRDKLYFWLTIVGLVAYVAIFWLIPAEVTEYAVLGVTYRDLGPLDAAFSEAGEEGLRLLRFDDEDGLRRVMAGTAEAWLDADGELVVVERGDKDSRPEGGTKQTLTLGLAFPDNFLLDTLSGREATVRLLVNNNTPVELRQAMRSLVREMVFMISGHPLPVTEPVAETVILGVDRMGAQISMRERMRPMLIFFVLMMESLSLASLISVEIMHCTVLAIAATPAKPSHILLAKTLFGMLLAFVQVVVILALIDAFAVGNLPILLVAAALGGLMFSGVAMFVGSMGKDFMGTLTWMMLFILPLAIPSVASLFPGSAPLWVRLVPSYSLIDILNRAANYGAGWLELAPAFGVLVVWLLGLFGLGWLTLSRKVARL